MAQPGHKPKKVKIIESLVDLYGQMVVLVYGISTFLKEHKMALDPSTEQKLQELQDAITQEAEEIKGMVSAGHDPAEINTRLDSLITAVKGISDQVGGA